MIERNCEKRRKDAERQLREVRGNDKSRGPELEINVKVGFFPLIYSVSTNSLQPRLKIYAYTHNIAISCYVTQEKLYR